MTGRKHFKHVPVTMLYQWLKMANRRINIFTFAAALPKGAATGALTPAMALSVIRNSCTAKPYTYTCALPFSLAAHIDDTLFADFKPRSEGLTKMLVRGELLGKRLLYFTGATSPQSFRFNEYKGLKTTLHFRLNSHQAVAIKVLSRALQIQEWQLIALLLDGVVINASQVKLK